MTKRVHWTGDMSNDPKSGIAVISGGMFRITWEDGTQTLAPDFTIKPQYGWTIADV